MAKAKIDKVGLWWVLFWLAAIGALYYFGYTTHWGAELLQAFYLFMLFWGFLSPLYVLIRMIWISFERKKAARLGLTYEAFAAERRLRRRESVAGRVLAPVAHPGWVVASARRLLRVAIWELVLFTVLLVLFGLAALGWRGQPGQDVNLSALGMVGAMVFWSFLGLQVLHRMWAHWHHRLLPGSVMPVDATREAPLTRAQNFWNVTFCLALLFAVVELALTGVTAFALVAVLFAGPALGLLLLVTVWRMVRPLFGQGHAEPAA
jgi:hypothetical protein